MSLVGRGALSVSVLGCSQSATWEDTSSLPRITEPTILTGEEGDRIVIAGDDPSNPLHIYRVGVTRRIEYLSQQLAQGTSSVFPFLENCMTYIDGFEVGFASGATPDAIVQERVGACGTYTGTLLALARCQGIQGRYINFHNYPKNVGHTVAELYIDEQWMLYDPTTHVYYAHPKDLERPLGYEEVYRRYRENLPVERVGSNSKHGRDLYSGPNIFIYSDPQGVIGPERAMRFPLSLHFPDRAVVTRAEFGTAYQGAVYIGAAGTNHEQRWTLSGLTPGVEYRFTIVPMWIGGDLQGSDSRFVLLSRLEGGQIVEAPEDSLDFSTGTSSPWFLAFRADAADAQLDVSHPYRGPDFRYMHVAEYRLEPRITDDLAG